MCHQRRACFRRQPTVPAAGGRRCVWAGAAARRRVPRPLLRSSAAAAASPESSTLTGAAQSEPCRFAEGRGDAAVRYARLDPSVSIQAATRSGSASTTAGPVEASVEFPLRAGWCVVSCRRDCGSVEQSGDRWCRGVPDFGSRSRWRSRLRCVMWSRRGGASPTSGSCLVTVGWSRSGTSGTSICSVLVTLGEHAVNPAPMTIALPNRWTKPRPMHVRYPTE
jgi:hypothetical protein